MSRSYVLSEGAVTDLRDITRYTLETWGAVQCRAYIADIERKADALARGEGLFKEMHDLLPGLRVALSGKHYLFCLPRQDKPAIILAILHERMDVMRHLQSRFSGLK